MGVSELLIPTAPPRWLCSSGAMATALQGKPKSLTITCLSPGSGTSLTCRPLLIKQSLKGKQAIIIIIISNQFNWWLARLKGLWAPLLKELKTNDTKWTCCAML